jgi:hypothetical protein
MAKQARAVAFELLTLEKQRIYFANKKYQNSICDMNRTITVKKQHNDVNRSTQTTKLQNYST